MQRFFKVPLVATLTLLALHLTECAWVEVSRGAFSKYVDYESRKYGREAVSMDRFVNGCITKGENRTERGPAWLRK